MCPRHLRSGRGGDPTCTPAPLDTYVDTTGAIVAMEDCPAGTYTTDKGSTSAAACVRVTVVKPANQRTYVNTAITGLSNIATKGVLPLTWSATGLPVGLVLSHAAGKIAGTPTKTCSCSVTLTATDADGHAGEDHLHMVDTPLWHLDHLPPESHAGNALWSGNPAYRRSR